MDGLVSNVAHIREEVIVWHLLWVGHPISSFDVVDLFWRSNNKLVSANFKHRSHCKQAFVEVGTRVSPINQVGFLVLQILLHYLLPVERDDLLVELCDCAPVVSPVSLVPVFFVAASDVQ